MNSSRPTVRPSSNNSKISPNNSHSLPNNKLNKSKPSNNKHNQLPPARRKSSGSGAALAKAYLRGRLLSLRIRGQNVVIVNLSGFATRGTAESTYWRIRKMPKAEAAPGM